jgi:hypothetical protein
MFGINRALSLSLAAFSVKNFSFQNERLKGALEYYEEGQKLFVSGDYEEACDTIMTGVFSGRKAVESMQAENAMHPESAEALEWLVDSYIICAEARIKLQDWDKARSDAWAACMISKNSNLEALYCMLRVCEKVEDLFGQWSVLKSMEAWRHADEKKSNGTNAKSANAGENIDAAQRTGITEDPPSLQDIMTKISRVEKALERKMKPQNEQ